MKDNELLFDRKSHVLYSKPCKKEILAKIALHYPEAERETVWEKVQRQYAVFLSDWRTDLGGKKNFHNGVGGTYDCIAIMSYDNARAVVDDALCNVKYAHDDVPSICYQQHRNKGFENPLEENPSVEIVQIVFLNYKLD